MIYSLPLRVSLFNMAYPVVAYHFINITYHVLWDISLGNMTFCFVEYHFITMRLFYYNVSLLRISFLNFSCISLLPKDQILFFGTCFGLRLDRHKFDDCVN